MQDFTLQDKDIIFLDNHLLVINKPAGILVQHDPEGGPNIEDAAKVWLKHKFNKPGNVFATATHRLDRPVSGLVILARTSKALARMNSLFAGRAIQKIYLALVSGKPENQKHLRHWIKNNESKNKVWTYTYERGDARQADLTYWLCQANGNHSLLLVRLFTGRHHQIRAQLAFEKIPILGDTKYGMRDPEIPTPALLSYAVSFEHPVTHNEIQLKAPLPKDGPWKKFSEPDEEQLKLAFQENLPQSDSNKT